MDRILQPSEAIKEVYLGLGASDDLKNEVKLVRSHKDMVHLKIFQMVKHPRKYELIPELL